MQPTKEQLRKWQQENRDKHRPPPTPEEVRRELGWDLIRPDTKEVPRKVK